MNLTDSTGLCPWCIGFAVGVASDIAMQVGTNIYKGQNFKDALYNLNLTQSIMSGAATAVGIGAVAILKDFYKAGKLFEIPFEELTTSERIDTGDLFLRAQAASLLLLSKKIISQELPWKPFAKDKQSCK